MRHNPLNLVDVTGLASLRFDGKTNTLVLYDKDGKELGRWTAHNNVTSKVAAQKWEDGTYEMEDTRAPRTHPGLEDGDTKDGAFGEHGIFRAKKFTETTGHEREGMGVHSGREGRKDGRQRTGTEHATEGCIRTTGEAMKKIAETAKTDPLTTITVVNNKAPVEGKGQALKQTEFKKERIP